MGQEAAIAYPCDVCPPDRKKRCQVSPRGRELDMLNERIKAAYPHIYTVLSQALCEKCDHRGNHRGCKFGRVPIMECGLYSCKYYRPWGDFRPAHKSQSKGPSVINKN